MRIYLDTSVYNRPFDDQTQPRIWLETLATALILQMIESETAELVTSSVVEYENSRNPFPLRQRWVNRCLGLAGSRQPVNDTIRQRALELEQEGIKAVDALHLACAEAAASDCFLTCDDKAIKRYSSRTDKTVHVFNPVEFVLKMAGEWEE
ncbi:MAG: PIN domain-containing protein [Thermoflexales bacterium]|nr:PIN domain-containing protein [Thermoflexales bacterium]